MTGMALLLCALVHNALYLFVIYCFLICSYFRFQTDDDVLQAHLSLQCMMALLSGALAMAATSWLLPLVLVTRHARTLVGTHAVFSWRRLVPAAQ